MLFIMAFLACPSGSKDSDSGSGGCGGAPAITNYNIECNGGSCEWWVEADAPMGNVVMTAAQTGDPAGSCGPKGDVNECGEWQETHDAFSVDGSVGACGERKAISLNVETDFRNQTDNQSTLFDTELGELTVLIEIYDTNGDFSDCLVFGDEPSYFSADCTNVDN